MAVIPNPYSQFNAAAYDQAVAADAPALWWKLADAAGSATAADSSGQGNTGTLTAVTLGVPGPVLVSPAETAGLFNGSSSTVTSSYNPAGAAITVEAWLNLRNKASSGTPRFIADSHTDVDDDGFEFQLPTSGGQSFAQIYMGNGAGEANIQSPLAMPAWGWVHLAATYDSTTMRLYQNGLQVISGTALSGPITAGTAGVGAGFNPSSVSDFFPGLLGQIAVYTTTLTDARIRAHYIAGSYV